LRPLLFVLGEGIDHEVISLLLHVAEGRPAETMEFEHDLRVARGNGEVDVAFLSGADFVAEAGDNPARF